ncbi:D-alanyl-D-alanine carboxypeptidase family protein [Shouchella shacheensis]|uniref:D-alanyl-D-alanine carboxypeptidase family protein n=1 Tax=Shouchella shacheensis TaxID=1649580 RepID=UPI000B028CA6|nr:D-alanyl-D-alanine carboxypeptidase family protein [Shouchella shacheensis]
MKKPAWKKMSFSFFASLLAVTALMAPQAAGAESLEIDGSAAILVDANSGQILFEDNIDEQLAIASMTKMMTEYLVLEAVETGEIAWDDEVEINDHVRSLSLQRDLSNVPLRQDYTYTVEDLYDSLAIYSANASTMALAEHISGSETAFVERMNEKAGELGLDQYEFINSSGLNNSSLAGEHPEGTGEDAETTLSARSVAQLASHLLSDYPEVLETASVTEKTFEAGPGEYIEMTNWNSMLPGMEEGLAYEGVDGLKTGFTNAAGNSFTSTAERDGMRLITVVMGTELREDRFNETAKLLDFGFDEFTQQTIIEEGTTPDENGVLPVSDGVEKEVSIASGSALTTLLQNGEEEGYTVDVQLDEDKVNEEGELLAPLEAGESVGTLSVSFDEEVDYLFGTNESGVDLVVEEEVEKAGWFRSAMRGIGDFFSGIWTSVAGTITG